VNPGEALFVFALLLSGRSPVTSRFRCMDCRPIHNCTRDRELHAGGSCTSASCRVTEVGLDHLANAIEGRIGNLLTLCGRAVRPWCEFARLSSPLEGAARGVDCLAIRSSSIDPASPSATC